MSAYSTLDLYQRQIQGLGHSEHELCRWSDDLMERHIRDMWMIDIVRIIQRVTNGGLLRKMIRCLGPRKLEDVLLCLDPYLGTKCVHLLSNDNRAVLLALASRPRREELRKRMDLWQALEQFNHGEAWLPEYVVTGRLPHNIPVPARMCVICNDGYVASDTHWPVMIKAACGEYHTFHEECEPEEGICPLCP
jgi:hypothetical protein